jgi:DNA-binding response OmpR family regulator
VVGGTVLLVEHEGPVRAYLEQQLADDGFEVLAADRGVQALDLAEEVKPDLVLLDAVLPDASGFELCSRLRDGEPGRRWNRDVPVIMVSARGDPVDRVRGFARGCDDYVVKPFVYDELVARMRAVLRRSNGPRHPRLAVRDLEIDLASRVVTLAGEVVQLSAKEFELLVALAEDPERVFKKEELLRNVWGFRSLGSKHHTSPNGDRQAAPRRSQLRRLPSGRCGKTAQECVPRKADDSLRRTTGRGPSRLNSGTMASASVERRV